MKRLVLLCVVLALLAGLLALTGCRRRGRAGGAPAYALIRWGSPKPTAERVTGERYVLPDGWKEAVAGVTRIRVSSFGTLQNDPATVINAKRFQELTGIEVEVLWWAGAPIVARTVSIFSAKSDTVDVLCYDHPASYMQMAGGNWLHPVDELWADANLWKFYAGPLKSGLTAADGHIYGSIGPTRTEMLFYRPSRVKTAPRTWQEVRDNAKKATPKDAWGYVFAAGGGMDVLHPFRAMVYSQGGRIVDTRRQRLVVSSPEGRNAWKMLTDMVLVDRSAPSSVVEYSGMQASDMFAAGKAAMVLAHTGDAGKLKNPRSAAGIKDDWAVSPPPKWDASQPDTNMASYLDLDGYMVNRFINDKQKAASMLFLDYMRSYEASHHELMDGDNEAAVLTVYDSPAGRNVPVADVRKAAMATAVLEGFPPAGRALTDLIREYFARAVRGSLEPTRAIEELQARLDDYAVPEK